jgi:hypothetical protein
MKVRVLVRMAIPAAVALLPAVAWACPMCNQTIAEDAALPRAYMYSILFMLGMPATVFSCLGIAIFKKFQAHDAGSEGLPLEARDDMADPRLAGVADNG